MICESGKVIAIEQDIAWVETFQTSSCTACSAKAGCGTGVLNSIFAGKRHYVKVSLKQHSQAIHLHDEVELSIPDHIMLKSSFWVYLLPLALMIAGALIGLEFQSNDAGSILGAVSGLILSGLILRAHAVLHQHDARFQPTLHRIIRPESTSNSAIIAQA